MFSRLQQSIATLATLIPLYAMDLAILPVILGRDKPGV
jgi:hypothetical protein